MNKANLAAHLILGPANEHMALTLSMGPTGIAQLRNILQRALNCAPPHDPQYVDWIQLSDLLEGHETSKGQTQKD